MTDRIVLVAGFGRCGSSLLMQMLYYAGMDMGRGEWPSYEDPRQTLNPGGDWVHEYEGKALKWLGIDEYKPKIGPNYRCVWLDRDTKEQARSWAKIMRAVKGITIGRDEINRVAKSMNQRRPKALKELKFYNNSEKPLILTFERLIENPKASAIELVEYLDEPFDTDRMAAGILPRGTGCASGIMERALLKIGPRP